MSCYDALRIFVRHSCRRGPRQQQQYPPTAVDNPAESWSEGKKQEIVIRTIEKLREDGDERYPAPTSHAQRSDGLLSPAVRELQMVIEHDHLLNDLFIRMFQEVPTIPPFDVDPGGHQQMRDYISFLRYLDNVVVRSPQFSTTILFGFPINVVLAWPMATPSGIAALLNEKVNVKIRAILNEWAILLRSPQSAYVLNDDPERGWLGSKALALMPDFATDYICNPTEPHYGFKSWDAFFTRRFREGARPVEFPNDDNVIVHACESTPYRLASGVQAHDRFWMKDQSYSLLDIPVSGVIQKAYHQAGAYYAQCPAVGFDETSPDNSQAYLSHVATRAMIFIEADNREIGLMCLMPVGIAECSSCELRVSVGQRVEKGEEVGVFHYGGSTYCMIFRPECKVHFRGEATKADYPKPPDAKPAPPKASPTRQ
ncbi:MAG: hypothetical protein Q9182_003407 [Xanthomendoza sp. 2 TL-2023]